MKRTLPILSLLFALALSFNSCSTRVDLYSDYKDIPVVYGLLDATQDTNYVKIVRAFSSNNDNPIDATQVALIADSSNYPGKLDARLVEYQKGSGNTYWSTGRQIVLDTITLHHKDSGAFYYPHQKVYFTTERFKTNADNKDYRYQLVVVKKDDTITAETGIVGGDSFKILTETFTFSTDSDKTGNLKFSLAENAVIYDIKMRFDYKEKKPGLAMTDKSVSWSLGSYSSMDLNIEHNMATLVYSQSTLFNLLASAIGGDTLNVDRYIGDFTVSIAAGGEELYNFIEINAPSSSISQNIPDYTNINGGYGVFSSRVNLAKIAKLSARTQTDLIGIEKWGFKQSGK